VADKVVRRRLKSGEVKEYRYERGAPAAGSVAHVAAEYRASPEFRDLARGSKSYYDRALARIVDRYGKAHIGSIRRRHVLDHRDDLIDSPGSANQLLSVYGVLFRHAIDRGWVEHSPALGIRRAKMGQHRRWTDLEIEASARLPEAYRRAVVLMLHTGLRVGDALRLLWSAWDGQGLSVVQQKTGGAVWIPAHKTLAAELVRWKEERRTLTILANTEGRPFTQDGFVHQLRIELERIGIVGATSHGLRKTAAARLAEAGATTLEIMAITGHASIEEVERYTREASKRTMAKSGMARLENLQVDRQKKRD